MQYPLREWRVEAPGRRVRTFAYLPQAQEAARAESVDVKEPVLVRNRRTGERWAVASLWQQFGTVPATDIDLEPIEMLA
jgi:hypothetical protein